jgi:mono/diheme cytochrome c family protein
MLHSKIGRRIGVGFAGLALVAAVLVPAALGHPSAAKPKIIGNATAGKTSFGTNCVACHTLKAAKSTGTIGPNLDKNKLATEALYIKAIMKGGAAVMTKAQAAKYPAPMQPYASLGTKTIDNIAAFVYTSTHKT